MKLSKIISGLQKIVTQLETHKNQLDAKGVGLEETKVRADMDIASNNQELEKTTTIHRNLNTLLGN